MYLHHNQRFHLSVFNASNDLCHYGYVMVYEWLILHLCEHQMLLVFLTHQISNKDWTTLIFWRSHFYKSYISFCTADSCFICSTLTSMVSTFIISYGGKNAPLSINCTYFPNVIKINDIFHFICSVPCTQAVNLKCFC